MEDLNLAGLIYDDEKFKNWNTNQNYDFFYLKGILEDFFEEFRIEKISWKKSQNDLLHPYASADIYFRNKPIGLVGSINPRFLKLLGLNKAFYYFEIKVESLPRNDLGKLIAFMAQQTLPVWDFEDLSDNWKQANTNGILPIIAIPTTAGTGSEVGRASVSTDK